MGRQRWAPPAGPLPEAATSIVLKDGPATLASACCLHPLRFCCAHLELSSLLFWLRLFPQKVLSEGEIDEGFKQLFRQLAGAVSSLLLGGGERGPCVAHSVANP